MPHYTTLESLKRVDLAAFCIDRLGYTVNKKKDCRSWRALKARNGTNLFVRSPKSDGVYTFFSPDNGSKGTIVELLIDIEGYTFRDVMREFGGSNIDSRPLPSTPKPVAKANQDNTLAVRAHMSRFPSFELTTSPNYYTRRGINMETLRYFGLGALADRACIPLWRRDKVGKWVAQTAITYIMSAEGERSRLFLKGCKRLGSYSILRKKGMHSEVAVICESPIDALSFYQLKGLSAIYISTCGTLTDALLSSLPSDFKSLGVKKVIVAPDKDEAGRSIGERLWRLLDPLFECDAAFPEGKDWNEELQKMKKGGD